jgi:6-phosphogluconolactonase/glucosamine-6-phosphate isomerase/deaminase
LEGKGPGEKYPSKLVQPSAGKLIWFIDRAAGSQLSATA